MSGEVTPGSGPVLGLSPGRGGGVGARSRAQAWGFPAAGPGLVRRSSSSGGSGGKGTPGVWGRGAGAEGFRSSKAGSPAWVGGSGTESRAQTRARRLNPPKSVFSGLKKGGSVSPVLWGLGRSCRGSKPETKKSSGLGSRAQVRPLWAREKSWPGEFGGWKTETQSWVLGAQKQRWSRVPSGPETGLLGLETETKSCVFQAWTQGRGGQKPGSLQDEGGQATGFGGQNRARLSWAPSRGD